MEEFNVNESSTKFDGSSKSFQDIDLQPDLRVKSKEYSVQMQNIIKSLREKRQEWIIQIGNQMHKKMRLNPNIEPELAEYFMEIEKLDKEIYIAMKDIENLKISTQRLYNCTECGLEVTSNDKFCGSCGTPVIIPEKKQESLKICINCEEKISDSAVFCPCCGQKAIMNQEQ